MAMTVNNLNTVSLLNILNKTTTRQDTVLQQMSTGSKINRGADDPAGLLAITSITNELTAVEAGISNNQRTDAVLGVADNALAEISNMVSDIQRLANETANDAALSADEIAANQAQIDDALASIDRIVGNVNFNGRKLIDGSLAINAEFTMAALTDVKVYSRKAGASDTTLTVELDTAASAAVVSGVVTSTVAVDSSFTVQGKLGTAVIEIETSDSIANIATKINDTAAQTGLSADNGGAGGSLRIFSQAKGEAAFVRTKFIEGTASVISDLSAEGVDAEVTVNGQRTAVDGDSVSYSGNGVSISFELNGLAEGATSTITVRGKGTAGDSGATFQLGTTEQTAATIGISGMYTQQLGTASLGYLASLASGNTNSLLDDPNQAAEIARAASKQISTLRGRIGGFQKFQVRTSLNSLNDTKEGLQKALSVVKDVDYAQASSELNRQNILLQSAMSLLGLANQQSSQVLSLLR